MDDDVLAATRILVIGGNGDEAESLRAQLIAAGIPSVGVVADVDLLVEHARDGRPDAVVCIGDADPSAVRSRIDPLEIAAGPSVVPLSDLIAPGRPLGASGVARLRLVIEHRAMAARLTELEALVASHALSRFRDTESSAADTLERLARAAAYRDDNSLEHTERVAALAARMARELGQDAHTTGLIRAAAPLHDLGKIAVPDSILLKPGRLDPEEFEVVKTHAGLGARVLEDSDSELLGVAERIARSHHERWDGTGYPDSLAGEQIPIVARLVTVADVFDVLVHERPYKDAWAVEDAAGEIRSGAGRQFDPEVVGAFDAIGAGGWSAGHESS
jgi:putative nucleotidyltransferase with HDIG domain